MQHAHQKGVIHRDLKPSNVLVALHDGRPVPKVIDFGVAKAIGQRLTEHTLFTEQRQLIGTPEYMSPEQAGADGWTSTPQRRLLAGRAAVQELMGAALPLSRGSNEPNRGGEGGRASAGAAPPPRSG